MALDVGFLAAALGGALALLSPCGAMLLPAFFAATVGTRGRLLLHAGVFYVGLCTVLVPLGLGAALAGSLVTEHRVLLVGAAGWMVVVFGVMSVLGRGFDLRRLVPTAPGGPGRPRTGLARTYLLGTVSGVAGFCAGPILGAVLTVAATATPLVGGAILALYAGGMVLPLVLIAATWHRLGATGRSYLRGREIRIGPVLTHTTSLVTGLVLIAVGITFVTTSGMATLPELIPTATSFDLQQRAIALGRTVPDLVVAAVLVTAATALMLHRMRRRPPAAARPAEDPRPTGTETR